MRSRNWYVLIQLLISAAILLAQQLEIPSRQRPESKGPAIPSANLRVDTNLVLVPTTVNDDFNRPVTGLEKENFRVFEDKAEQAITSFSSEDEPIALGFIFDTSG